MGEGPIAVGLMLTAIFGISGLIAGRVSSWLIANAMRLALLQTSPLLSLVIYLIAVVITGAMLGSVEQERGHLVFDAGFITGFVVSPAVFRGSLQLVKGRESLIGFAGSMMGPTSLLLALMLGFVAARLPLLHF